MQCPSCANAKKHASRYSKQFDEAPPTAQAQIQIYLQKEVRRLYNDHVSDDQNRSECIDKFTHDTSLVQSMKMLAASGVMGVHLSGGNMVRTCGSSSCHQISVVKQQSNSDK